ncbi:MAG: hypothetical protein NC816_05040 [Candidatus Omnitrophica bacterium]|nr:hypothetical protein [Candidatus Omnitrophota bacterium]
MEEKIINKLRKIEDWWKGKSDCPLIQISKFKDKNFINLNEHWKKENELPNFEKFVNAQIENVKKIEYFGVSYPCLSHSWGNRGTPMTMSAYIGGKVIFGKDTVWFEKVIDDWRKFKVEFKEENFWVNASKKLLEKQIEKSNGEFLITMPDFGDALTCFSLLKGVENLLIDIIEIPDLIIEKIYEFVNAWIKTHKFFHSIYSKKIIGDTTWLLWAPGRTYACQSDFSTMISPKLFEKFVVFELEILSEYLEYMAWHLDGPDEIKHLDILLSLPYIKVIQIVPGAGRPPCASPLWLPIIDKILKNGKNVITYASNKEEFEILIKSFYSGKIFISCGIVDIEDQKQKEFFNFVEKYI